MTRATLDALVRIINNTLDSLDVYYVQGAYGRVRLVRAGGSVEVSPSLTQRELEQWMRAFIAGIDAGRHA